MFIPPFFSISGWAQEDPHQLHIVITQISFLISVRLRAVELVRFRDTASIGFFFLKFSGRNSHALRTAATGWSLRVAHAHCGANAPIANL
jgi:hypothetical protein